MEASKGTHEVFKRMVLVECPLPTATSKTLPLLTDLEINALCYVVGYMCHALHNRLKSSNIEGKRQWYRILVTFTEVTRVEIVNNG